jgi:lipoprotein-anchoring transpeptidase ErfK/SrfK
MKSFNISKSLISRVLVMGTLGAVLVPGVAHAQEAVTTLPAAVAAPAPTDVSNSTSVAAVKDGRRGVTFTVYATPDTSKPLAKLTNLKSVFGRVVFVVKEDQGAWLKVLAPIRQNGGVGYIQSSIIDSRFLHDWKIKIEIGKRQLTLTRGSEVILTEKVAVGLAKTPTPLGTFYTVDIVKPKKPNGPYGAFAYGLSAFSPVYQKFGTGDGRVGLHGTSEPGKLGTAASNGCIRISNEAITKMRGLLPLGVPVEIVA